MASLYKKPVLVRDPKTGQRVKSKSKKWWGRFRDDGIEKRVPLATDKAAAQAMLTELIRKAERRAAGVTDRFDEHRKRPVEEHLNDFEKHLRAKGVSDEQVKLVGYRARRIFENCKAALIGDLSASRVQTYLADLRTDGASMQTSNHYLRAVKQFTRWLVRDRRAGDDPLAFIAMLNVAIDRRHDRRPISEEELKAIVNTANAGPVVLKMKGPDRAMLYMVAAYTRLRASELSSLTPASFDLDGHPPTVTVQAGYSKHRRRDVLPLHDSLVTLLRSWLAAKCASKPVWPGNWARNKAAGKMLQCDLERAGIQYRDEGGLYRDFHALRHTFITNMVKSGVSPKTAQTLARHSTIDLTMNVYTSLTVLEQASALASLPPVPSFSGPESATRAFKATGTDGPKKVPPVVPSGAENGAELLAPRMLRIASDCTNTSEEGPPQTRIENAKSSGKTGASRTRPHRSASDCRAERQGFSDRRLTAEFPSAISLRTIASSSLRSTPSALLRWCKTCRGLPQKCHKKQRTASRSDLFPQWF